MRAHAAGMQTGCRAAGRPGPQLLAHQHIPIRHVACRAFEARADATAAPGPSSSSGGTTSSGGGGPGGRQMYIQESLLFTGAELAARIPSMQAALRAQRAEAAASTSSSSSSAAGATAARPTSVPPVTPGPSSSAAAYAAAVLRRGVATQAAAASAPVSVSERPPAAAAGASSISASAMSSSSGSPFSSSGSTATAASSSSGLSVSTTTAPPPPSPGSLEGLSASEKLAALAAVQAQSRQAIVAAGPASSAYASGAPKTIDIRMYDQLVAAHNRLSRKLGEANAHIDVLEGQIADTQGDLLAAYELFKQIAMEFGTTSRLAQSTAAAVQFGVDPQDALDKVDGLTERLATLEAAVLEQRKEFGLRVVRKVPVEWIGVASEVRVMGDFDAWTRGHELSAEDITTDSVYSRFEGTLMLRPGSYRVKFLVDGEWRLAADWPTEDDADGNTVNVLTVA